jgi:hypothetical protein
MYSIHAMKKEQEAPNPPFTIFHVIVIAATLLAAVMRLYRLHSLPPPAWFDEVWFALRARELITTGQFQPFYESNFGGANAGPVWLTALSQLIGFDMPTGGRVMAALAGVLSIPLAYVCTIELLMGEHTPTKTLDRRMTGMLTAVVLVYTLFYVTIGRIGMEIGIAPATALFIVWQMARAVNRRAWGGWVFAGLVAGIAQYNGLHARFILPLMAFWIIQEFIFKAESRRFIVFGTLIMLGIGLLVNLPLLLFFIKNPQYFTGRASIVVQPQAMGVPTTYWGMLRNNAWLIFKVFRIEGSYDPKNGVPGIPLLDWVQTPGFVVGLVWAVWRLPKSAFARTTLFWLVLMSLPSLLTEGAPNLGRMIGIAPPTAVLVAVGWVLIAGWAQEKLFGNNRRSGKYLAPIGAVLILGSLTYHTYLLFIVWPEVSNLREQFTAEPVDLALDMLERAESEVVFAELIPESEDIAAFEWYFPGQPIDRMDFRKCLPLAHQNDTRINYLVISGHDRETVGKLLDLYPESEVPLRDLDLWQTTASVVEVPPGAIAPPPANQPAARFDSGISLYGYDWSGDTLRPEESLFLTFYWQVTEPVSTDWTAFTHIGTGLDDQPLVAQRDGLPCLGFYPTSSWKPGLVVIDSFAVTIPADTPPGEYDIAIGWYAFPSLERLALLDADQPLPDNRAIIGSIRVVER